jgi:aryl-alcohol dehydrogenase-like predicted oxidoreductase
MKTVRLGKTGLKVSGIEIGGIPLTRPTEDESKKLEIREILAMPLKKHWW